MPTVLVIDETRAPLDTLGGACGGAGFRVRSGQYGPGGLRLAGPGPRSPSRGADLRLPDVTDVEVLKQLRQTLADVR